MSLKDKKAEAEKTKHIHRWIVMDRSMWSCDQLYNGHPCDGLMVTNERFEIIQAEWNNYYQLCQHTKAHDILQRMQAAVKSAVITRDFDEVHKIRAEIQTLCHYVENEYGDKVLEPNEIEITEKPYYPDPGMPKAHYTLRNTDSGRLF